MKSGIALIATVIIFTGCFAITGCDKKSEDEELTRVKEALQTEFSDMQPFVSADQALKYHYCTFFTVENKNGDGYSVSGKIFFYDQFGDCYYYNYSAYMANNSWAPEITKSALKKMCE